MRYSLTSHAVLVGVGVDLARWEGDAVADDVGNDINDQDTPSVDV